MSIAAMRDFIIKFVYISLVIGLTYILLKYILPLPFIIGFLIAFLLKPIINKATRKLGLNRKPISILVLISFYIIFGLSVIIFGGKLLTWLKGIIISLPDFYTSTLEPALIQLQDTLEGFFINLPPDILNFIDVIGENLIAILSSIVAQISSWTLTFAGGVAGKVPSFIVDTILTIIVSFFFVVDYYNITGFIVKQIPPRWREILFHIKHNGSDILINFEKAYAILLSITFIELSLGLWILKVDHAIIAALCIALVDILPILGTGTILIPWGIIQLIIGNTPMGIGLLVLYGFITVVRQTLEPRIIGHQIGLHPLATLLCMFVGAKLFGLVGMLGSPIILTIFIQLHKSGEIQLYK